MKRSVHLVRERLLPPVSAPLEPALPDHDARFHAVLEAAPDAMLIVGADGRICLINAQAEKLFGYPREALTGQSMDILLPERLRGRHAAHRQSFTSASAPRPMGIGMELLARHQDGHEISVEVSLSNMAGGGTHYVICSIRDISERRRGDLAIRQLNEKLEELVARRTADLHAANEELRAGILARRRLEEEILQVCENERQRIGHDLHDDLGQQLAGIWMLAKVLENSLIREHSADAASAAKITGLLKGALELTRALSRGLHPVALEAGGLMAALDELAQRSAAMFRIQCDCHGPAEAPMENATATHLYRIAQEAVTNAVKHGQACRIEIKLSTNPLQTVLSISDNGTGLPAQNNGHRGLGLRIMHYRADLIGGQLTVRRKPSGSGTIVTCVISPAAPRYPAPSHGPQKIQPVPAQTSPHRG